MQPPIPVGTLLQNRYRIVKILGQGGFGRTYLAQDQRRFDEFCAIKELIPIAGDAENWQKAQELFAREAATLYQIHHPQIPQFREQFEQEQRLFLVQDYVAGKNYRALLEELQANGNGKFTHQEVLHLLISLLPVLEYIHSQRIIHRDISPENIILRDRDKLPVLIDFGVVKEIATQIQSPHEIAQVTTVGKVGYSPSEQIQAGTAYPSSDLYALAVTAIVLLTGKEPKELFDETQASWNWEIRVTADPQFAQILNRMLSYRPSERYGSAAEVARSLKLLYPNAGSSTPGSSTPDSPTPGSVSPSTPDLSQMRTVAVGRSPQPSHSPANAPDSTETKIPQQVENSILDSPLAIVVIIFTVALVAGFSSWAVVSFLRQNSNTEPRSLTPQNFPSPIVSNSPTPTQPDIPEYEEPVIYSKRLRFDTGDTAEVNQTIKANETIQYTFFGKEDQNLTALISENADVVMTLLAPNREPIDDGSVKVVLYQGKLPFSGKYIIQLNTAEGVTQSSYQLKVKLEKPVESEPETPIIENTPQTPSTQDTPEQPLTEEPLEETPTIENIPEQPGTQDPPEQFPSDQAPESPSFPINPETDPINPQTDPINPQTDPINPKTQTEQLPGDDPAPIEDR